MVYQGWQMCQCQPRVLTKIASIITIYSTALLISCQGFLSRIIMQSFVTLNWRVSIFITAKMLSGVGVFIPIAGLWTISFSYYVFGYYVNQVSTDKLAFIYLILDCLKAFFSSGFFHKAIKLLYFLFNVLRPLQLQKSCKSLFLKYSLKRKTTNLNGFTISIARAKCCRQQPIKRLPEQIHATNNIKIIKMSCWPTELKNINIKLQMNISAATESFFFKCWPA